MPPADPLPDPSPPLPRQGGNLEAAGARWGIPAAGWLDLSTGVNPRPYPLPPLAETAWTRLPEPGAEHALQRAAALCYRTGSQAAIVPAPGTQALIQALPRTRTRGRVAVLGPTYAEHLAAWSAAGHDARMAADLTQTDSADVVVTVNPNNPDGRVIQPEALIGLAGRLAARGGLLVVDEAFCDLTPELSVAPRLVPGMVVLRSFGKFYGLAGLRLGFALGLPAQVAPLAEALGPWAVSGPALAVGAAALADSAWAENARARLSGMALALDRALDAAGFTILGGTSLFRLARHAEAATIYDRLGRAGILVRAFADYPDRLRFGLPGGSEELQRLERALL